MLTKSMMGRLGNQMFQYATMRALQERYYPNEKLNLSFRFTTRGGKAEEGFCNQLGVFRLNRGKIVFDQKASLDFRQKVLLFRYFLERKIIKVFSSKASYNLKKRDYEKRIQWKYNKRGLYLFSYGYYDFKKSSKKNKFSLGFMESPKYFDDIRDLLLDEFTPIEPPSKANNNLYKEIKNSNSVCISIRRGDYLSDRFKASALVCDGEYFDQAIELAKKKIKDARFVVFSDDIDWVKKNMNFPEGTLYESGKDSLGEKIRLMYSCKHFVISNSSFSWWAQYLSRNEKKIVIAPSIWRKVGYDGRDLYNDKWELIKC